MKSNILKISVLTLALCSFTFANAQEKKKKNPEKMFKKMDSDANGTISLDEFKAAKPKADADKLAKRFSKMDADASGEVSMDEFKKFTAKMAKRKAKKAAAAE